MDLNEDVEWALVRETREAEEARAEAWVAAVVDRMLERFNDGFEERLAIAIQKALDAVVTENEFRLHALEEDMARILRHLGLE